MQNASDAEHKKLEALVGKWHTQGETRATDSAPSIEVDAIDTYEWLHGGYALIHTVEASMGHERVQGAEIIGYVPEKQAFITQYYGNDGPNSYEATLANEGGALTWRMVSKVDRFTDVFNAEGNVITGHWEAADQAGAWRPWMDITLTKM